MNQRRKPSLRWGLILLVAGCAAPLRQVPATDTAPSAEERAATSPGDGSQTIVGHVASDGAFVADTVSGLQADTARVDRVTVLTGAIRAPSSASPSEGAEPARESPPESPPESPAAAVSLRAGYRVQVFAARSEAEAAAAARDIETRVSDVPVYVAWDEPWHKVRLGDFPSREAAEPLRRRLVELGFTEAWTVPTAVRASR